MKWALSVLAVLAMLFLLAAGQQRKTSAAAPVKSQQSESVKLGSVRVVDLTYSFDEKTIYWPTSPTQFQLQRLAFGDTPSGYFYAANSFCAPEHGGTHLDAPVHFKRGGASVDQIPVRQLIARAVVIDISGKAEDDPDYRLSLNDVTGWEKEHGAISPGEFVLLRTGWGKRWPDRKRYLGDDTPNDASRLHFPSYGKEAVQYLVKERKVVALGVDTASIDHGPSKDFIVHQIAFAAGVFGLENLANLEQVPVRGAWVIALPMKIAGGSGGPLRAVALVPGEGELNR